MTLDTLKKFINRRNRSEFATNLQFGIDANAAGLSLAELGEATKTATGYYWTTPLGTLVEDSRFGCGRLALFKSDGTFVFGDTRIGAPAI